VMQEEWEQKIQFFRFFSCCYDVMQGVGIWAWHHHEWFFWFLVGFVFKGVVQLQWGTTNVD
jgi:hypothetical protein